MSHPISAPNFTMTPNIIYDYWLKILSPYEFCVLSFMCRKIFGFHKQREGDRMSLSQIAAGTGQARSSVVGHIKRLIEHGLVIRFKGKTDKGDDDTNLFTINIENEEKGSPPDGLGVVCQTDQGVVRQTDTQKKTYTKENQQQEKGAGAPVAVFSCLKDIQIPTADKEWISANYDESTVQHGVLYATHPETKIKTSLAQVLKWACKTKPEIPIDTVAASAENKRMAEEAEAFALPGSARIVACAKYVEINTSANAAAVCFAYEDKNFKTAFQEAIVYYKFKFRRHDRSEMRLKLSPTLH